MSQEQSREAKQPSPLSEWFWIILTFALFLFCLGAAWVALKHFGPAWGLLASAAAFLLYVWLGPAPMPGLLPGLMAMWVLSSNVFCGLVSVVTVIRHFVHHVL